MNRRFPLATVARVRRLQTGLARLDVARAKSVELAAETGRGIALAALAERSALDSARVRLTSQEFRSAGEARTRRAEQVGLADGALTVAQVQTGEALDGWRSARSGERAIDLLEDVHRALILAADLTADQRVADDRAGSAAFARTHDGSPA